MAAQIYATCQYSLMILKAQETNYAKILIWYFITDIAEYIFHCSYIKKEWNFAIWNNMDRLGEYYSKQNKSDRRTNTV